MKRLLLATTSAAVLMGMSGAASAQSVLERVLQQTDAIATTTGVFANTADNIGTTTSTVETPLVIEEGVQFLARVAGDDVLVFFNEDGDLVLASDGQTAPAAAPDPAVSLGQQLFRTADGRLAAFGSQGNNAELAFNIETIQRAGLIDASITNTMRQIDGTTSEIVDTVSAVQSVNVEIGNIATTALGAVNTGDIEVGSNLQLQEAIAGESQAIQNTVTQLGSQIPETEALMQTVMLLNSSLNTMDVTASITNELEGVNATIGRSGFEGMDADLADLNFGELGEFDVAAIEALTGGLSTTALGAVNTGTIISGVNGMVNGSVTSIVGNAAANVD